MELVAFSPPFDALGYADAMFSGDDFAFAGPLGVSELELLDALATPMAEAAATGGEGSAQSDRLPVDDRLLPAALADFTDLASPAGALPSNETTAHSPGQAAPFPRNSQTCSEAPPTSCPGSSSARVAPLHKAGADAVEFGRSYSIQPSCSGGARRECLPARSFSLPLAATAPNSSEKDDGALGQLVLGSSGISDPPVSLPASRPPSAGLLVAGTVLDSIEEDDAALSLPGLRSPSTAPPALAACITTIA